MKRYYRDARGYIALCIWCGSKAVAKADWIVNPQGWFYLCEEHENDKEIRVVEKRGEV